MISAILTVNGSPAAMMESLAINSGKAVDKIVDDTAAALLSQIKRNASGRPGPNAPTGDYRRSWTRTRVDSGWLVGTNRPQARRLEYGFNGIDSLGRHFNQPPRPHVEPAVDAVQPDFERKMAAVADLIARFEGGTLTFGRL